MSVLFIWFGPSAPQVSAVWHITQPTFADRLHAYGLDRLECLSPLFEVISSLNPMPFELKVDIYVTRPSATGTISGNLDDKETPLNEKADGERDPEAMSSLPTLTRQSSGSDQTSDNGKSTDEALSTSQRSSSLYTLHAGRPDVPAMVKAFGAAAIGESVAVAGKSILVFHVSLALTRDLLSVWPGKTQC